MPLHSRAVLEAPAKLNLCLDITGGDGHGYHLLDSVMLSVSLFDIMVISLRTDGEIRVLCSNAEVPLDGQNLATAAAKCFLSVMGLPSHGLDIFIDKRIPLQAGLAGGSADAAAVLEGLDYLFQTGLTHDQMKTLSLMVGSDVPFCVRGGCARARGRGEQLRDLPLPPDCWFTIAKPAAGMSTNLAFELYDRYGAGAARPDVPGLVLALEIGDLAEIGTKMHNVFEDICAPEEVRALKAAMLGNGALGAVMSGSGTAVAGLFPDEDSARLCLERLKSHAPFTFAACPTNCGSRIIFAD